MIRSENVLGEKYVRILKNQKILLHLIADTLEIRLYPTVTNGLFYKNTFTYDSLSDLVRNIFNSLSEILT